MDRDVDDRDDPIELGRGQPCDIGAGASEAPALLAEIEVLRAANRALLQSILVDPGTGLPNAAAFDADQLQLDARRRRSGDRYSVLLVHLDRPSGGAGATFLKPVADTLRQTVRLSDRAYRLDGNRFAVLLPGSGASAAVAAGERIRAQVQAMALKHPGSSSGVATVTIGAVESGYRHSDTKEVVAEAGRLVAEGRRAGGNRVVWPR